MSLEDIPEVDINDQGINSGFYKFVLIKGSDYRDYLHARTIYTFHTGVFDDFKEKLTRQHIDVSLFRCTGDGLLSVDNEGKTLKAHGSSTNYGKFDTTITRILLENYARINSRFQGFAVQVE